MNGFTEEHIFNYIDQLLSPEETAEFELELKNNEDLKKTVDQLRTAHLCFLENKIESGSEELSNLIMAKVTASSNKTYYRPSGLFHHTGFLLVAGILTALVAFLSLLNAGYFDIQSLGYGTGIGETDFLKNMDLLKGVDAKRLISNSMLVIYGLLALGLVDRLILNPIFRRRYKHIGLG